MISLVFLGHAGVMHAYAQAEGEEEEDEGPEEPGACDNSFMEALKSRAWTMGKRELEMAQAIILKPDSTLEYGCWKYRLKEVVRWAPFTSQLLRVAGDNATTTAVIDTWVAGNFGHNYGGGMYPLDGAYNCDNMNKVWYIAKCQDFKGGVGYNPPVDHFMTFKEIVEHDPRILPAICDGALAEALQIEEDDIPDSTQNREQKWWKQLAKSYREAEAPPRQGHPHAIITYLPQLDPRDCSKVTPVPTGYIVDVNGRQFPDATCPATACWYDPFANPPACKPD